MSSRALNEQERRRRVRRTAVWLTLVALVVYAGFIALSVVRGS